MHVPKDIRGSIEKVFSGLASNGGDYILFRQVLKTRPKQKDVLLLQSSCTISIWYFYFFPWSCEANVRSTWHAIKNGIKRNFISFIGFIDYKEYRYLLIYLWMVKNWTLNTMNAFEISNQINGWTKELTIKRSIN
jgi:hypothetical protein